MVDEIVYQFKVKKKLWESFKDCLRKVYWKGGISINEWLIKSIEEFVNKNMEEKNGI